MSFIRPVLTAGVPCSEAPSRACLTPLPCLPPLGEVQCVGIRDEDEEFEETAETRTVVS